MYYNSKTLKTFYINSFEDKFMTNTTINITNNNFAKFMAKWTRIVRVSGD